MFCKKLFLEISQISQENTCAYNCEICLLLKDAYFEEQLWTTASKFSRRL